MTTLTHEVPSPTGNVIQVTDSETTMYLGYIVSRLCVQEYICTRIDDYERGNLPWHTNSYDAAVAYVVGSMDDFMAGVAASGYTD